jgi:hypothetical protein
MAEQIKFIGNRNAASGKAEAVMVKVDEHGDVREVGYDSLIAKSGQVAEPLFDTREDAVEWAKQRWNCN